MASDNNMLMDFQNGILEVGYVHHKPNIVVLWEKEDSGPKTWGIAPNERCYNIMLLRWTVFTNSKSPQATLFGYIAGYIVGHVTYIYIYIYIYIHIYNITIYRRKMSRGPLYGPHRREGRLAPNEVRLCEV